MSDSTPTPAPATTRLSWWQNEDWLAVIAAAPLIAAVVYGWKFKLPGLTWTSAADISKVFSSENLLAMGGTSGLLIL